MNKFPKFGKNKKVITKHFLIIGESERSDKKMYNFPQQPQYYYQPQFQQRPQMPSQPMQMETQAPMPQNFLKGRPVVSIEEARAAQIDLDGSLHIFTDIGNKKIYTKQINLDGTATLNVYQLIEDTTSSSYITRDEFEKAIQSLRAEIGGGIQPKPSAEINF